MTKKLIVAGGLFVLLLCYNTDLLSQGYLRGTVSSAENSAPVLDALVQNTTNGELAFTNADGHFTLAGQTGDSLLISALGYETARLAADSGMEIRLKASVLDAVTIVATRQDDRNDGINKILLTQASIKNQTLLAGESDPIRALHYVSGVTNTREGQSGLVVRGGLPDQNLIMIDGVRVYNYAHLFGFLSFINSDMINDMTFYKAGIPAEYGGRSSSVVDINLLDGNLVESQGAGSVGLLTSKVYYSLPLVKNKLAISGGLRASYFDVAALFQSDNPDNRQTSLGVADGAVKLLYKPTTASRMTATYLATRDKQQIISPREIGVQVTDRTFQNRIAALNYGTVVGAQSYMSLDLGLYSYGFTYSENSPDDRAEGISSITEYSTGASIAQDIGDWQWKYGLQGHFTTVSPLEFSDVNQRDTISEQIALQESLDISLFMQGEGQLLGLDVDAGLRLSGVRLREATRLLLLPRIKASQTVGPVGLSLAYDRNYQTIFQSFPIALGAPVEIWLNTDSVSVSEQLTLSTAFSIGKHFSVAASAYHRTIDHINTIGDVYQKFDAELLNLQESVVGNGDIKAEGIEVEAAYNTKSLKNNLAIGLQRSNTTFEQLNAGSSFPTDFSRAVTVSYNGQVVLGKGWTAGVTAVFQTGQPVTLPVNSYFNQRGFPEYIFGDKNNARYPRYTRFDILLKKAFSSKSSWVFSVYNIANARNPFHITLEADFDNGVFESSRYRNEILFGILPTIAYEFTF